MFDPHMQERVNSAHSLVSPAPATEGVRQEHRDCIGEYTEVNLEN